MNDTNMNFAIVEDNIVTNIIWVYPNTTFYNAVPCNDYPVAIGDTYSNGKFYRDGKVIQTESEDMQEALKILGVSE